MLNSTTRDSLNDGQGPYALGASIYRQLGWDGVLPTDLDNGLGKVPPGYSGYEGGRPSDHEIESWIRTHGTANLGLRLGHDLIAIDVDCYHGGCETLAWFENEDNAGELPPTWTSTARQDGSKHYFYRIEPRDPRAWKSKLGKGIEILRYGHRWSRVWPSLNPKTGGPYRWYRPDGTLSEHPPRPSDLPPLPERWLAVLLKGDAASHAGGGLRDADDPFDWSAFVGGPDSVEPGEQNDLLYKAGCSIWGGSKAGLTFALTKVAETFRNEPGHPKGDWTPEAVAGVVNSVTKLPHGHSAAELSPALQAFVDGFTTDELTDGRRHELQRLEDRRWAERTLDAAERAEARGPRPRKTMREFLREDAPAVVLPRTLAADVNLLGGPSAAGKSLLARDWALEVAASGRYVLWIASEGMDDKDVRWGQHPAWTDELGDRVLFLDPVDLCSETEVEWLAHEYADVRPALTVLDLVYDMGMSDENGFKDVNPIIRGMKALCRAWSGGVLALGHSGHNGERRFRGSSSWRQRAYVEWHMAGGSLTCEKSKIARKCELTRTYELDYPSIRWTSLGEALATGGTRTEIIQRDIDAHPGVSDKARAERLAPVLGLSIDHIRKLIRGVTK